MFNIHYYTDYFVKISSTRPGKIFYSVLAGSLGVIILVLFLTGMTFTVAIGDLLPVIFGFNTALTGYMVLEKTRDGFKHKRSVAIGSGAAMVLITASLLNIMFFREAGIFLIDVGQLMTLLFVGIVSSGLSGMLAIKYLSLQR
jgi:drug/metabolite transporter (DMT)-like permease